MTDQRWPECFRRWRAHCDGNIPAMILQPAWGRVWSQEMVYAGLDCLEWLATADAPPQSEAASDALHERLVRNCTEMQDEPEDCSQDYIDGWNDACVACANVVHDRFCDRERATTPDEQPAVCAHYAGSAGLEEMRVCGCGHHWAEHSDDGSECYATGPDGRPCECEGRNDRTMVVLMRERRRRSAPVYSAHLLRSLAKGESDE